MKHHFAEVVLIRMRFHQTSGSKVRPARVLLDTGDDDFIAAPITSRAKTSAQDLQMCDWREAGLNLPSVIRVHKLTVLSKDDVVRQLGRMSDADSDSLTALLCRTFCPQAGTSK